MVEFLASEEDELLEGKNVVITGCLQGIGRAVLGKFVAAGARVFACSHKRTDEFEEHVQNLNCEYGERVIPVYFDLMDNASIKDAARAIQKEKLPIHALLNIAGINLDAVFPMVTPSQLQDTFQVNFFSQIIFSQYISKLMRKKGGSIVFTSSISAIDGNHGQLSYSASKAALLAAMKTMSKELGPSGIRVNAIAPGVIRTPMTDELSSSVIEEKLSTADIKRLGEPEDVANILLFLASDDSAYITGQTIRVDGGIGG